MPECDAWSFHWGTTQSALACHSLKTYNMQTAEHSRTWTADSRTDTRTSQSCKMLKLLQHHKENTDSAYSKINLLVCLKSPFKDVYYRFWVSCLQIRTQVTPRQYARQCLNLEVTCSRSVDSSSDTHRERGREQQREITQCFLLCIRSLCNGVFQRRIAAVRWTSRCLSLTPSCSYSWVVQRSVARLQGQGKATGKMTTSTVRPELVEKHRHRVHVHDRTDITSCHWSFMIQVIICITRSLLQSKWLK